MTDEEKYSIYRSFLRIMQKNLKKVGTDLSFSGRLTPYVARHTHANVLLNRNASLEQIRESLAQKDIRSTMVYTHSLWTENRRKVAELLLDEEE